MTEAHNPTQHAQLPDSPEFRAQLKEAFTQTGVAVSDEAFADALVYGTREYEKAASETAPETAKVAFEQWIAVILQRLAEQGRFAPAEVASKAREIAALLKT